MKKSNTHDAKIMDSIDMLQRAVEQMNEQFRQLSQRPATIINNYGSGDVIADGGKKIVYATCNSAEHMGEEKDAAEGDASAEEEKTQCGKKYRLLEVLNSEIAEKALGKIAGCGYLDADFVPTRKTTIGMAAYIAQRIGQMIGIDDFYNVFGGYWGYNSHNMGVLLDKSMGTKRIGKLIEDMVIIESESIKEVKGSSDK